MAIVSQMREVVDAFSQLVQRHLQLARAELADDAKFVGLRLGIIAGLAPLLFVGYGLLCLAGAFALQRVMAADVAFLVVGLLNLLPGLVGIALAVRQLTRRRVLAGSIEALEASTALARRPEVKP